MLSMAVPEDRKVHFLFISVMAALMYNPTLPVVAAKSHFSIQIRSVPTLLPQPI